MSIVNALLHAGTQSEDAVRPPSSLPVRRGPLPSPPDRDRG